VQHKELSSSTAGYVQKSLVSMEPMRMFTIDVGKSSTDFKQQNKKGKNLCRGMERSTQ